MKQKISISIEKDSIDRLEKCLENGKFRNKSHVIEYALNKFLEKKR